MQKTKYDYVVVSPSPEFATEVCDLILNVPTQPYDTLKQQLIARTAVPEQRRLQSLFHSMELGDRRPTQLLRWMQQLLRDSAATSGPLLRELFLQCLPPNVRMVLASSSDAKSLDELANLADKVLDAAPTSMASIAQPPPSREVDDLRTEVASLKEVVALFVVRGPFNSIPLPIITTSAPISHAAACYFPRPLLVPHPLWRQSSKMHPTLLNKNTVPRSELSPSIQFPPLAKKSCIKPCYR